MNGTNADLLKEIGRAGAVYVTVPGLGEVQASKADLCRIVREWDALATAPFELTASCVSTARYLDQLAPNQEART